MRYYMSLFLCRHGGEPMENNRIIVALYSVYRKDKKDIFKLRKIFGLHETAVYIDYYIHLTDGSYILERLILDGYPSEQTIQTAKELVKQKAEDKLYGSCTNCHDSIPL